MSQTALELFAVERVFDGVGEMYELCRAFAWSKTALGPVEGWSPSLLTIVQTLLAARLPTLMAWGPERNLIYNDGVRSLLGAMHPAALGMPLAELGRPPPELLQPVLACIEGGAAVCHEEVRIPIAGAAGHLEDAWFSVHCSPLRDETGALSGAIVTSFDTTRSKHAEQRQAFLLNLIDRLRVLEDPIDIQLTACRLLGEHLKVNRCTYAEVEGDSVLARPGYVSGVAQIPEGHYPLEAFGASLLEACRRGESVAADDVNHDDRFTASERQTYASLDVRAYLVVWVVKAGRPVGTFGVHQTTPRHWTRWERELIREVAERIWSAIRRAKAEAALRRSEQTMRVAEAHNSFLLSLGDAFRRRSDPRAIMSVAAAMLARHLRVTRASFCLVDADEDGFEFAANYSNGRLPVVQPGTHGKLSDYGPGWGAALRSGTEIFSSNNETDHRELLVRVSPRQPQAMAGAAIPLIKDGHLVAFLSAGHMEPHDWIEEERSLLREVAERTWASVQRARAEQGQQRLLQQREDLLSALTAAIADATRANQAKDDFLATLGHELRTPLSAILLWAGALKSRKVPEADLERAFEAILSSAQAQSRLIEDLLDLSRLVSGKLVLTPRRTIIENVARAAIDLVQGAAQAKGIGIELIIRDYLRPVVLDASRLQQVLLNLLSNAVKFTPPGGKATLCLAKRDQCLEAVVSDTGRGIAPDFMPHVFERFRQAEGGDTRQQSGLGIGLALSRQLVELQGGSIEAISAGEGRGATFTVRIPWIDASYEPEETPSSALRAQLADLPLRGLTVLLVEDDASTRHAMEWTLTHAGGSVMSAGSASETLELLDGIRQGNPGAMPDVIVSDLGLPGTSGYDLIRLIARRRLESGLSLIPACAVSAHARDIDRQRALDAGFDMYLTKPVVPERLIAAVRDLGDVGRSTA
jgi:signal transduction histidine kinase/ActR/RegA family two-component response regulator